MPGIETYGGSCPLCNKPVLIKHEGCAIGALQFDACPHCGFITFEHAEKMDESKITQNDRHGMWLQIIDHHCCKSIQELQALCLSMGIDNDMYCVFDYSVEPTSELKSRQVPLDSLVIKEEKITSESQGNESDEDPGLPF